MSDPIVIVAAARTPIGGLGGSLATATAAELGGVAIAAALARAGLDPDRVDELIMGCVLQAGQGQAPARQAGFKAGLPNHVPASTVNKMCGSGMKAVMLAHDALRAGGATLIVAGGMESMSNAPYLLPRMRAGARLGHAAAQDHVFLDGLEDAYEPGRLMGDFAEDCATAFGFSRAAQDAYALASLDRARAASASGAFAAEIAPVAVVNRWGATEVAEDERPRTARPERIPTLPPVFRPDGTITAANAAGISDGAAALAWSQIRDARRRWHMIARASSARRRTRRRRGLPGRRPIGAIQKVLKKAGWEAGQVDLWEINEAFAAVTMAAMDEFKLPHDVVNVHGGACALGHPIGASGARLLVTLLRALERRDLATGVATLCVGGGEATAIAIERA